MSLIEDGYLNSAKLFTTRIQLASTGMGTLLPLLAALVAIVVSGGFVES